MYNIPYFKESDPQVVLEFMHQHSFAMLIGSYNNVPVATQVPLLIEQRENGLFLQGHFMRQTDHHKAFEQNPNALCIFTGAHSYVSASWYTQPQVASTWNYMSVHARGELQFLDEPALLRVLEKTTAHYENNANSAAAYHHLPKEYVQRLAKAIVAFEIEVNEVQHVFKLSQNRDEESYQNIIQQLNHRDSDAQKIAAEMQKRTGQLFNRST